MYTVERVVNLSIKKNASELQANLAKFVGAQVTVKANSGRKHYEEHSGVLDGTYSKLFVVKIDDPKAERKLSFSYVDLLTGNVILMIHREGKAYQLKVSQKPVQ